METLVVVAHNRNHHQYCCIKPSDGSTKYGSFGSPHSPKCQAINCRTFQQSGEGLLRTPFSSYSTTTPVSNNAFSALLSPQTTLPSSDENKEFPKRIIRSKTSPIPIKINEGRCFDFSERWAGPTYSNSPPPSSLPIPKFSMRPKRTVSLDLPTMVSEIDLHPIAKSAPASPTRERSPSSEDRFETVDFATKTLRRILNLDIMDE